MVGGLRDVITCAEFQIEIFMGYDFTGGRIFDFPIDFSMGLTTVQRYCAACDIQDSVYGAVIMEEPLREFTRFIWWMQNGAKRPPTQDQALLEDSCLHSSVPA